MVIFHSYVSLPEGKAWNVVDFTDLVMDLTQIDEVFVWSIFDIPSYYPFT